MSSAQISEKTLLPEPTVSKVLKLLSKSELVQSVRGAQGGYALHTIPQDITVAAIVSAVDGPVALTSCVENSKNENCCDYHASCPVKGRWDAVNAAVKTALDNVFLSDMIAPDLKTKNNKYMQEERV